MSRKNSKQPVQHQQSNTAGSLYRFLGSTENFVYSDERFRPTWTPRREYRLKAKHRHQLCVHLAAHAAVSNLAGAWVHMLAVAPVGVRSWTISERKSLALGKVWGVCSTSDFYCSNIVWDEQSQVYMADRDTWEYWIEDMYESLKRLPVKSHSGKKVSPPFRDNAPTAELFMEEHRRVVRAQACGYLAGHIADGISAGMGAEEALMLYDRRDTEYVGPSDIAVAQGLTALLTPGEYEHAVQLTEEALRRPDVWAAVQRVAVELEKFGLLEGNECETDYHELLPSPVDDWPYAPGSGPDA